MDDIEVTERQKFEVLKKFDGFEVREYAPCVLAEIEVEGSLSRASSQAFGALFNYISKGNLDSRKIAMTAPVTAASSGGASSSSWVVSFVMPANLDISHLPLPQDSSVTLRSVPAELCAVLAFRGRADLDKWREKEIQLRKLASENGLKLSGHVRINRFDPPFKPGAFHYNEVAIPLDQSESHTALKLL